MKIETGFYGIPGKTGGKVHLRINGKPACGARFRSDQQFQFCSGNIHIEYIECRTCKRIAINMLTRGD